MAAVRPIEGEPIVYLADRTEIRLVEPGRPGAWTDQLDPTQYAVFLSDVNTAAPHAKDGTPRSARDATCTVCNSLSSAEQLCEEIVRRLPALRCEIFDASGRANPPLLVITHPMHQGAGGFSEASSRGRRLAAIALVLAAGPALWFDWHSGFQYILPTFLGLTAIVAAIRIVHWELGARFQEQQRAERLDAARRRDRDGPVV